MSFVPEYIEELDEEMRTTRPLIERVPMARGDWRPHPKSFPVGHLTQLVARMPGWITNAASETSLDLATYPGYSMESTQWLLAEFDRNVSESRAALGRLDAARLDDEWSLRHGDTVLLRMRRRIVLRQTLNHLIHHRGQLSVNLRLLDVPVPCVYGPTADERGTSAL